MKNKSTVRFGIFILILTLASISCGVSNLPFLATETPTPTSTFTPAPTFTPSPQPTSTPTDLPTPTPLPTGASSQEQDDGSTLFIDYDNQYQFVIPADWFVIPLSTGDIADILATLAEESPELSESAELFSQLDSDLIRVIALNDDPKYVSNEFASNLSVTALEDELMSSMPIDFVTGAVEEQLTQQGATLLSEHELSVINSNGVEIGSFSFEQAALTATGASIQIRSKTVIFQSNGKLVMMQLVTPVQFGDELLPKLDEIADSVKLLVP
jgi:hypothetical protein